MSESRFESLRYVLDGEEPLTASYDDDADVLYLSRGDAPREAVGLTTEDGHVVRFDPETGEVVGFTILDWRARWGDAESIEIVLTIPAVGATEPAGNGAQTHSVVAVAG
jgi:uncharacterized protein YuzE